MMTSAVQTELRKALAEGKGQARKLKLLRPCQLCGMIYSCIPVALDGEISLIPGKENLQ